MPHRPPAPKERPVSLASSGALRAPLPVFTPSPAPRQRVAFDDALFYGFIALVLIGMLVMGYVLMTL